MINDNIIKLVELIKSSEKIVALTGAGISTESGIPDFRSPDTGLWTKVDPEIAFTKSGFLKHPEEFFLAGKSLLERIINAQPTKAHYLLARLEKMGKLMAVITQNIDGLHQKAGSVQVIEAHGNLSEGTCLGCLRKYLLADIIAKVQSGEIPPRCDYCRDIIKPDVVLFGDPLPVGAITRSAILARDCEVMIVLGSSLIVYPVADLPRITIQSGGKLVILNLQPTFYDHYATIVMNDKLGDVAEQILAML
jgi:NAD-dependent deacetylase